MESITAKKKFCSPKCRVYFSRTVIKRGPPFKNMPPYDKTASNLADELKIKEIPSKDEKTPPSGLKGIELAIWKSENLK